MTVEVALEDGARIRMRRHGNPDGVRLLLSGDGSSGKRPLADGRCQVPGGWNRIHLQVADLEAEVARLRGAGVAFRTDEIVSGPGGAQVIIDDPSGNPIELFQPRRQGQ